jgi:pentatricopeptide repeat protein
VAAAEKAEFFLKQQKDRYASGDKSVRPNVYTYCSVINACARAGKPERAESFFREMYEDFAANGNNSVAPNTYAFNSTFISILLSLQDIIYLLLSNIFSFNMQH